VISFRLPSFSIGILSSKGLILIHLPSLQEILDSFEETEFWYVDQGIMAHESAADGSSSFRKSFQRQEDKWWLPVPRVSPGGLQENSRKQLQHKRDCTNQILKAAMAINSITLADMEIPESYLESLPRKGRSCLGDLIYRYISSDQFSPECLLDCLDLSSEHQAIEIANRVESSIYLWHKRTNSKPATNTKTSWEMVKELMVDADKLELMADRAESLLLSLKQRFPGLPQTALDMSKIQYNKDIGKSILESYSRVLESLAFNIVARIDDLLFVDDLTRHSSDQIPTTLGNNGNDAPKSIAVPVSNYTTPSYSPSKQELRSSITVPPSPSRFKIPHSSSVKRVLTAYVTKNEPRLKNLPLERSSRSSSSERLSLEKCMKESLNVSNLDPGI
jgi:hypothetical protein